MAEKTQRKQPDLDAPLRLLDPQVQEQAITDLMRAHPKLTREQAEEDLKAAGL